MKGRRRTGQVLLGLGLSALLLWLAVRQLNFGQVIASLQQVRVVWLVPALVTLALDVVVRSARWAVLLRPVLPFSWRRLVPVMTIGYMGNVLLPARLGELLRAGVLGRHAAAGEGLTAGPESGPATPPQVGDATWRETFDPIPAEFFDAKHNGFLQLDLGHGNYSWQFIAADGTVIDNGKDTCSGSK